MNSLSTQQILDKYELPQRLLALFAALCAKDVISLVKDPRSLAAIDMAERYGLGADIPIEERNAVADAAYAAASAASHASAYYAAASASYAASAAAAAAAASNAAYAASASAYAAYYAYASHAASAAAAKRKEIEYRDLLIHLINTRLSEVERALL